MKIKLLLMLCVVAVMSSCDEDSATDEVLNATPTVADQSFTIDENAEIGTAVGVVQALDPEEDALNYAIDSGNESGAFEISSSSGELTVIDNTPLDFETNSSFELMISVSDGESAAEAIVTIQLNDIDEGFSNYLSIDGVQYELSEARLQHTPWNGWNDKIHALWLVPDDLTYNNNEGWYSGVGEMVFFNFLVGSGKFEIEGSYSLDGSTDGLEEEIRAMESFNIYNEVAVYWDYDHDEFNGTDLEDGCENLENYDDCFKDFSMEISKADNIYTIDMSLESAGRDIIVYYEGPLELVEGE